MSTYNDYLHDDFKRLGFPEYVKMLDSETCLTNLSFLSTRENLQQPPVPGQYAIEFDFTIITPTPTSGKRPYIGLIQATLTNEQADNQQENPIATQLFYPPLPNRQDMREAITKMLQARESQELSSARKMNPEDTDKYLRQMNQRHKRRR